MKKLFGELQMTWRRVILFAVIAGIYTGVVMCIPFLKETSFQDIGITYEWWVIFAVIIVVNCPKMTEAALKCFVFFLLSQPLVYVVEALLGKLPLADGWRYYQSMWLPMTVLTLPGGAIAYWCKKQNAGGAAVLGLGNTIIAVMGLMYCSRAVTNFPHHLLSGVACVCAIVLLSLCVQKKRANQLISVLLPIVLTAMILLVAKLTGRVIL